MSMTDPIADMLTRLRNASKALHERVEIPASNVKVDIAKLLKEHGFIENYRLIKDGKQGVLRIVLRYHGTSDPAISGLKRISRPGRRVYRASNELPSIRGGLGVAVISTSRGVVTDTQARTLGVGGEVICAIW